MPNPLTLGIDLGSSFLKVAILDTATGASISGAQAPAREFKIDAPQPGFAEQDPEMWWEALVSATRAAISSIDPKHIAAIGIAYQMHGLVPIGENCKVLHPAIIWCDSRATEIGRHAFDKLGHDHCLTHLLNSPGNFTASKLKWLKDSTPKVYQQIVKVLLPGDYLAARLTGRSHTTLSGLSEGIFWDFAERAPAHDLLGHYGIAQALLPELVPTFGQQGTLTAAVAQELGLPAGIPITYRAGDQPNNAYSLNALEPGEIAATAGTSGVIYAVSDKTQCDPQSRVNVFAHVNYAPASPRCGILLCISGTGIANAWLKKLMGSDVTYEAMNALAAEAPVGSDSLSFLPFGNGAERILGDRNIGAQLCGLDFNRHSNAHLCRAVQEGIVYSFKYGFEIMQSIGVAPKVIRAGRANMFLSPVFRQTFADTLGVPVELYETDGALGAARGAAQGAGIYHGPKAAFAGLKKLECIEPNPAGSKLQAQAYAHWLKSLNRALATA